MFLNWFPYYRNNVVSYFTGRNAEQFVINVLDSEEAKEQALDLIMQLLRDDPIIGALDIDLMSAVSFRNLFEMYLNQDVALGCYTHTEGTLVAVDNLYVRNIRDAFPDLTEDSGKAFKSFIKFAKIIERHVWYKSGKRVCNYLLSMGIFISPAYRAIGITNEMIRMRILAARSLRMEVIGSAFIGNEMQDAAKKHKYRILETFRHPQDMPYLGLDFNYGQMLPVEIRVKVLKIKNT